MFKIYKILLPASFFLFCQSSTGQKPKNINEAIAFFEKHWTTKEKIDFKNKPERAAVTDLHFSTGMWIRNKWIHGRRNLPLKNQFNGMGIFHPDDMSSIILTSLHRKLNGLSLNIEEQVEYYNYYWKKVNESNKRITKEKAEIYNRYTIGDTIKIKMFVDTSYGQRNAIVIIKTHRELEFDPQKDLLINGVINNKYFQNDSSKVFFSVKILTMNFERTKILMREVKPNDIFEFQLGHITIE